MIGDLILSVQLWFKQLGCIHEYVIIPDKIFGRFDRKECKKCNRSRNL